MTETARMYGGSLYDLAAEEGLEARILGELDEAVALFKANPDYLHLLSTPSIPKRERCGLLDEALRDQVHLYVLNFLKIPCAAGQLPQGALLAQDLQKVQHIEVIAERKAKADSQIADAAKLRTEAEAMKAEYEQNLQNARPFGRDLPGSLQGRRLWLP